MAKKRPAKRKRARVNRVVIRDFPPDAVLHERYPGENPKRWEAFCFYRDLDLRRSHAATARGLGKSEHLIARWSREDRWAERIESFEAYRAAIAAQALQKSQREYFHRQMKAGRALETLARRLVKKKLTKSEKVTANEILRMIELAFKLQREVAVGKSTVSITGPGDDDGDDGRTIDGPQPNGGAIAAPVTAPIPLTYGERMAEVVEIYERARERAASSIAGVEAPENNLPPQAAP